jgi:CSLREA domain-containing protein
MAASATIHNLMIRRALLALAAIAASLLLVLGTAALPAQAQSITIKTVNTTEDEDNTDGDCSLREAIQAANTNAAVDACTAGSSTEEDTIGFALGTSATITLDSQLPNITDAAGLAINGGQADIAINGQGDDGPDRAFWIDSGAKLALDNMTVTQAVVLNGPGGAIHNDGGELSVTQSTFSGNRASLGVLPFGGGGGAIYNDGGEVTVSESTFSENTTSGFGSPPDVVEGGGAIHNTSGTLTVSDTTFSGNGTDNLDSSGGGILDVGGLVTITNSTFVANNSDIGGGIAFWKPPLGEELGAHHTVTNSTFSGNAAFDEASNIYCETTPSQDCGFPGDPDDVHLQIRNTIVANSAGRDGNCNDLPISDGGYNISDDASCGFDQANNSHSSTDPLLDPTIPLGMPPAWQGLQDNGGPTMTIALQQRSPAIDAIPTGANGCATDITQDQRGVARPRDGNNDGTSGCDIGAFERDAPTITRVKPVPGSGIRDRTPLIAATVRDAQTNLAKTNIKLFVDGNRKTTFSYDPSTGRLSYTSGQLSFGRHTVKIVATDGVNTTTKSWRFKVVRG